MRRVAHVALLLASAVSAAAYMVAPEWHYTLSSGGRRGQSEHTSMPFDVRWVGSDPAIAYSVPIVDTWWNVKGLFHSKRVPQFATQRYRDRLFAGQLRLASASLRRSSVFSCATHTAGEGGTLIFTGICKGAAQGFV